MRTTIELRESAEHCLWPGYVALVSIALWSAVGELGATAAGCLSQKVLTRGRAPRGSGET